MECRDPVWAVFFKWVADYRRYPPLESDTHPSSKFRLEVDGRGSFDGRPAVKVIEEFCTLASWN